jgi:hypothetical protein
LLVAVGVIIPKKKKQDRIGRVLEIAGRSHSPYLVGSFVSQPRRLLIGPESVFSSRSLHLSCHVTASSLRIGVPKQDSP